MSRIFDADSDALLNSKDVFKMGGKEYRVPDIKMKTMLEFEKLERSNESKFATIVDQIFLVLKDENDISKKEIEGWGFKTCLAFIMWLFEPLQEMGLKKTAESLKEKAQPKSD
ncbi:hypothetical protein IPN35_01030 [Candidatus Peregrinibacteria bacterium]|jgi:hypothetical protein|nr:MAG: hypothetical protein IPN35_01030 [Candidatus Peregrinibacteria bacterium]